MVTIYALTEPNGEIRYVGSTTNPGSRLRHHVGRCNASMALVNDWVRGLLACGLKPEFVTLAIVSDDEAAEWERHFIAYHHCRRPLLNRRKVVAVGSAAHRKLRSMIAPAANGWPQTKLARALGVSQQVVSRWVHGEGTPERRRMLAIESLLGIPASDWSIADAA